MIAPEKHLVIYTLVPKTTYNKVFLNYQVNIRFPSLCLASENAIFGSGRRRKKKAASPQGMASEDGMPQLPHF